MSNFDCPYFATRCSAEIKPHRDYALGYEDGNFRLHIPIVTNSKVQFILDGAELTMLPGECWYTNVNYVHSVANLGESDRYHLVIDGERNEWSDELFFSLASEESFQQIPIENASPKRMKQTIEELKRSNNPVVKPLIKRLLKNLKELK